MAKVIKGAVLLLIMGVMLFPIYLMVMNSFTPSMAFLKTPPDLLPYEVTLKNYQQVFRLPLLGRWAMNTLLVVVAIVWIGLLTNCAAGYVFAYAKGFKWLFWLMMTPMFVTRFVLLISQFLVIRWLHIRGLLAVILMPLFWPTGIFLSKNYFETIPISLLESARIDGAGELRILLNVILPVSKPLVGASVAFLGMAAMGDYIWGHLILQNPATKTYLVGLMQTTLDVYGIKNVGYDLAVGVLLFIPYLVLFAFSSKYFISGLTGGALKEE